MTKGPWSTDDLTRAVAMRNAGSTPDAIGAVLGRSAALYEFRRRGVDVPLRPRGRKAS